MTGKWPSFPWVPALVLAVLFLIFAVLLLPSMHRAVKDVGLVPPPPGTQLYSVAQQAILDAAATGTKSLGWPSDSHALTSREYFDRLVSNGYLKASDLVSWKADQFVIGNVSDADPAETIFLVSRNWYDAVILKKGPLKGSFIVIRKGGDVQEFKPSMASDATGALGLIPSRCPAFLEP